MTNDPITIRRAESPADYRACQEAQKLAWGLDDDRYVVPVATMVGAQLHGGLVLGAFLEDGSAVGVSFAFLGRTEGRLCLYSQLTGVAPGYQSHGLGARLKHAQRDFARSEEIGLVAWAFDPLQAGNARFNLDKLGATAGRFIEDMYGPRSDALNRGPSTDRLIAEWTTSEGPRSFVDPIAARSLPRLIRADLRADGSPLMMEGDETLTPTEVLIEIPADIAAMRASTPDLAEAWALAVRRAFRAAFSRGYRADGFVRDVDGESGRMRCAYRLRRRSTKGE